MTRCPRFQFFLKKNSNETHGFSVSLPNLFRKPANFHSAPWPPPAATLHYKYQRSAQPAAHPASPLRSAAPSRSSSVGSRPFTDGGRSWSLRQRQGERAAVGAWHRRQEAEHRDEEARREQEGGGAADAPPRYHRPRPRRAVAGRGGAGGGRSSRCSGSCGRGDAGEALVAAGVQVALSPPVSTVAA
jgi:hypothetical protein